MATTPNTPTSALRQKWMGVCQDGETRVFSQHPPSNPVVLHPKGPDAFLLPISHSGSGEEPLSTTPTALRPARCAEIAPKAVIEMWWQLGSLALFFSAQEFSCLYDPIDSNMWSIPVPLTLRLQVSYDVVDHFRRRAHQCDLGVLPRHNLPSRKPVDLF